MSVDPAGPTELYTGDRPGRRWNPPESDRAVLDGFPEWLDQGRYRRESRLGRGGMGVVYAYRDPRLDRLVAVKAIPRQWSHSRDRQQRFLREARVLAALDHSNIARVHHLAREAGIDYLIYEFVPGRTLDRVLGTGPLPLERALHINLQLARAIAAGHEVDIIHRDVKPSNIMVTPNDDAKLLDFGLARYVDAHDSREATLTESPPIDVDETGQGPVLGTPGYMSPEQARGLRVDHRTDIWAFGCVLFESLSGYRALRGADRDERVRATLEGAVDWPRLPADTPAAVRELIEACLVVEPEERLRSLGRACDVLEAALETRDDRGVARPVPHNLPAPLTSYVPRDGELERLQAMLAGNRLLTLTGAGGCGKTRLAQALARTITSDVGPAWTGPRFTDGVWLVKLASVQDPELVPQAVASAWFGERASDRVADRSALDLLLDDFATRRAMFILDNCEHLIDACRDLVERLLPRCPELCVLATSRESLEADGEQVYPVPRLTFPESASRDGFDRYESVQLFADRARLAQPDFDPRAGAEAVAAICRRLEGIPLAIELAAASTASLPVHQVAERLLEVVGSARVIEASITSSVDLLDRAEQVLLGRLSVFAGGWTLEAAEGICGDGDTSSLGGRSVIGLLSRLVHSSLVLYEVWHDRARYHLLETVRQYARRHLVSPEEHQALLDRHLAHYRCLAREADENFSGDEQIAWLDRLEVEVDNLRQAIVRSGDPDVDPDIGGELARDLHMFTCVRGYVPEGRRWLDTAIERRRVRTDTLQAQLFNARGIIAERQGDLVEAARNYESGLGITRLMEDGLRTAGILTNLGLVTEEAGDQDASRRCHVEALEIYTGLANAFGIAMVQLNLATVALPQGCEDEARALLDQCLPVFRAHGDDQRISCALHHLGCIEWKAGRPGSATELLLECLDIRIRLGDRRTVASTVGWLGVVWSADDPRRAAACFGAAEHLLAQVRARLFQFDQLEYETSQVLVKQQLDAATMGEAWQAGAAMELDDLLEFARGDSGVS